MRSSLEFEVTEEKVESMWLMKCLVFHPGKDWRTETSTNGFPGIYYFILHWGCV